MDRTKRSRRRGFTLLEAAIGTALIGLVLGSAVMVQRVGTGAHGSTSTRVQLENEARRALDRIVIALTTASRDTLVPDPNTDFGTEVLEFRQVVDVAGALPVLGPTQRLEYDQDTGRLLLVRDAGGPNQRVVVLSRSVAEFAPGETLDFVDENGNGVIDERGFNIVRVGELLVVRLTLSRIGLDGREVVHSVETSTRLRN